MLVIQLSLVLLPHRLLGNLHVHCIWRTCVIRQRSEISQIPMTSHPIPVSSSNLSEHYQILAQYPQLMF